MAQYPCDGHGGRYGGAQQTIYPALIDGQETLRRKLRLCPRCFDAMAKWIGDRMVDTAVDDPADRPCPACHEGPGANSVALFATVYAKNSDRADYYGVGCLACKPELASALGLA